MRTNPAASRREAAAATAWNWVQDASMKLIMSLATAAASTVPAAETKGAGEEAEGDMAALLSLLEEEGETAEVEVDRRVSMSFFSDDGVRSDRGPLPLVLLSVAVVVPLAKPAALAARAVTRCMQNGER